MNLPRLLSLSLFALSVCAVRAENCEDVFAPCSHATQTSPSSSELSNLIKEQERQADDITVLPVVEPVKQVPERKIKIQAAEPIPLEKSTNVKSVQQPAVMPVRTAPIVSLPAKPITLTPHQRLQQEIGREQAGLAAAQKALAAAQKKNDAKAAAKWLLLAADREANLASLKRELRR